MIARSARVQACTVLLLSAEAGSLVSKEAHPHAGAAVTAASLSQRVAPEP